MRATRQLRRRSAATLEEVVEHYVATRGHLLAAQQRADLVAFLKTL